MKRGQRQRHSRKLPTRRGKAPAFALVTIAIVALLALTLFSRRRPVELSKSVPAPSSTNNSAPAMIPASQSATNAPGQDWRTKVESLPKGERAEAYSDVGDELLVRRHYAQAVEAFRLSIQHDAASESVHYNLGIALAAAGKVDEAIQAYEEALKIAPDYAEAHNNLGNLYLRKSDFAKAATHFREAIAINPGAASGYNNLAIASARQGRPEDAVTHLKRAVDLQPNYLEAHFNLAQSYLTLQQTNEAAEHFGEVLKLNPDFTPAQRALQKIGSTRSELATNAPGESPR